MSEKDYQELLAMMAVIYKKLDDLEREVKHKGRKSAPLQSYLDELRNNATKVSVI